MKRPATVAMADLARHPGLSTAAVSRALRHHPAIPVALALRAVLSSLLSSVELACLHH